MVTMQPVTVQMPCTIALQAVVAKKSLVLHVDMCLCTVLQVACMPHRKAHLGEHHRRGSLRLIAATDLCLGLCSLVLCLLADGQLGLLQLSLGHCLSPISCQKMRRLGTTTDTFHTNAHCEGWQSWL